MSDDTADLRDRVRAATAAKTPLRIVGGSTKAFYGEGGAAGDVLDVRGNAGILDYDPAELVITARGGTPLAEVEAALAAKNQMLAFEPPHFGDGATFGGCIASGLSGPRRASSGAVRDFILGATVLDGRSQVLRFGGQVMKNVAGYDVARLMAGAMGTLGVLLDVSVKILPRAPREATIRFACDEAEALRRLNDWGGKPLPISGSAWHDGVLHVRLSGAIASVDQNCVSLGGTVVDPAEASALWTSLREQTHAFFAARGDRVLWRLSVPSTTPVLALDGARLVEWGGAQRWLIAAPGASAPIRAAAQAAGGHAVAFRRDDPALPAFEPLSAPLLAIQRRLEDVFDPAGIFNRGRLRRPT